MKRHTTVIIALKAEHSYLKISHFLKVARSFGVKVHKTVEVTDGDSRAVAKHKMHAKGPNTNRTPKFV